MADNISELPQVSQGEIGKSGRWDFLKKVFKRRQAPVPVIAKKEVAQTHIQIPDNSGIGMLIKTMESGKEDLTAGRIRLLYPDFIEYLNEDLKNKYSKSPRTLTKIADKLNAGDCEVIEMFARRLAAKYLNGMIQNRKSGIKPDGQLGYKKREAELLAYELKNKIKNEKARDSRSEYASEYNDWKLIVNEPGPPKSPNIDLDKALADITLDPALPASTTPSQK